MRGRLRLLRIFTCALAVAATLEFCTRLEDWIRYRAPFWGRYDMSLLFPDAALTGAPNARFQKYQLNSLGYRGPEPRSGTIRIACVGSSETFGVYEDPGKQYPRQLEDLLNRDLGVSSIEVLNIAHPGHNLHATVEELPQILDRVHPQFLVMYPSTANYGRTEIYARPSQPPRKTQAPSAAHRFPKILSKLATPARALFHQARTVATWFENFLERGYDSLRFIGKTEQIEFMVLSPHARAIERQWSLRWYRFRGGLYFDHFSPEIDERFRSDLQKIADLASARGVRLVLVLHANNVPAVGADGEITHWNYYYPYTSEEALVDLESRLNRVMTEVAAERGLMLVDAPRGIPKGRRDFADFTHFTNEGANRMAHLIAPALEPQLRAMLAANRNR